MEDAAADSEAVPRSQMVETGKGREGGEQNQKMGTAMISVRARI